MANVVFRPNDDPGSEGFFFSINGVDFSKEVYAGDDMPRIVEVGSVSRELGIQVTFALTDLSTSTDAESDQATKVPALLAEIKNLRRDLKRLDRLSRRSVR